MGVLLIITDEPGQINQPNVRRVKIISSDNLATVTTASYLNPVTLQGFYIYNTDIIDMWYGAVGNANYIQSPGTYAEFYPTISNGVITLNEVVPPGGVTVTGTPTAGHIARFAGASSIQDGGVLGLAAAKAVSDNTKSVVASVTGSFTAGHIATFADTAGTIQDGGALGQAATKSVSDNTKSSVASVSAATVLNNLLKAADIAGTVADSGIGTANVMQLNATNTLSGSGSIILVKGTGIEASNAVTINNQAGVITTSSLTTAGGASYTITFTNSFITTSSVVLPVLMGGTNTTKNITLQATAGNGTSTLTIYNNTAATALDGTILIGFLIV
jgi:hypothetical protein